MSNDSLKVIWDVNQACEPKYLGFVLAKLAMAANRRVELLAFSSALMKNSAQLGPLFDPTKTPVTFENGYYALQHMNKSLGALIDAIDVGAHYEATDVDLMMLNLQKEIVMGSLRAMYVAPPPTKLGPVSMMDCGDNNDNNNNDNNNNNKRE